MLSSSFLAKLGILLGALVHLSHANASVGLNLYNDDGCLQQFAAVTADGGVCNNHNPGWSSARVNAVTPDATQGYIMNFYGHPNCVTGAGTHGFCGPTGADDNPCLVMGFAANSYSFEPSPNCVPG